MRDRERVQRRGVRRGVRAEPELHADRYARSLQALRDKLQRDGNGDDLWSDGEPGRRYGVRDRERV